MDIGILDVPTNREDTTLLSSDSDDNSYNDNTTSNGSWSEDSSIDSSMDDDVTAFVSRPKYYKNGSAVELDFLSPKDIKVKLEKINLNKCKRYRCKMKDEQLYHQMLTCIADFITPKELRMLWHKYDTALNESLNYSIAVFAPKTAIFSGTVSLSSRVSFAIGVHSRGREQFITEILSSMGVQISPAFASYLR